MPFNISLDNSAGISQLLKQMAAILQPPKKMGTTEWAEKFRGMSAKSTALPGKYNASLPPPLGAGDSSGTG